MVRSCFYFFIVLLISLNTVICLSADDLSPESIKQFQLQNPNADIAELFRKKYPLVYKESYTVVTDSQSRQASPRFLSFDNQGDNFLGIHSSLSTQAGGSQLVEMEHFHKTKDGIKPFTVSGRVGLKEIHVIQNPTSCVKCHGAKWGMALLYPPYNSWPHSLGKDDDQLIGDELDSWLQLKVKMRTHPMLSQLDIEPSRPNSLFKGFEFVPLGREERSDINPFPFYRYPPDHSIVLDYRYRDLGTMPNTRLSSLIAKTNAEAIYNYLKKENHDKVIDFRKYMNLFAYINKCLGHGVPEERDKIALRLIEQVDSHLPPLALDLDSKYPVPRGNETDSYDLLVRISSRIMLKFQLTPVDFWIAGPRKSSAMPAVDYFQKSKENRSYSTSPIWYGGLGYNGGLGNQLKDDIAELYLLERFPNQIKTEKASMSETGHKAMAITYPIELEPKLCRIMKTQIDGDFPPQVAPPAQESIEVITTRGSTQQ